MSTILAIDLGGTRCRIGVAASADPAAMLNGLQIR